MTRGGRERERRCDERRCGEGRERGGSECF